MKIHYDADITKSYHVTDLINTDTIELEGVKLIPITELKRIREEIKEASYSMKSFDSDRFTDEDRVVDLDDVNSIINEHLEKWNWGKRILQGKWIWQKSSKRYVCSVCNHFPWRVETNEGDDIFTELSRYDAYKYCPTCGAEMESQKGSE